MRLVVACAGGLAALILASAVFAHAEPERVTPGNGAVVTTAPGEIVIEMTQDLARQPGANDIDVFDDQGNEVTGIAAVIDNATRRVLSVPLPVGLRPGTYRIRWKTLSDEDGDTADGELTFRYDPAGPAVAGQENLRDDVAVPTPEAGQAAPPVLISSGDDGASWILVTAVGVAMFALGCGVTFVAIQKRP
ncbi:MAG TPA: copper resistance CopC family protein [Tepidiformaceae bacterium]|nr:copper resistance CopC family protein [Tepidiformaceae bacterium]